MKGVALHIDKCKEYAVKFLEGGLKIHNELMGPNHHCGLDEQVAEMITHINEAQGVDEIVLILMVLGLSPTEVMILFAKMAMGDSDMNVEEVAGDDLDLADLMEQVKTADPDDTTPKKSGSWNAVFVPQDKVTGSILN